MLSAAVVPTHVDVLCREGARLLGTDVMLLAPLVRVDASSEVATPDPAAAASSLAVRTAELILHGRARFSSVEVRRLRPRRGQARAG